MYDRLSACRAIELDHDRLTACRTRRGDWNFNVSCRQPAGLVVNRSTARRVSPARPFIFAVFNDTRNGWVASRILKHLRAPGPIVLRVVIDKWNALGIVIVACLLTIRTTRFRVND